MDALDYRRLCDELSVVQATLLIVDKDPSEAQSYIEKEPPENRPKGYDAAKAALVNAILRTPGPCPQPAEADISGPQGKSEDQPHAKQIVPGRGCHTAPDAWVRVSFAHTRLSIVGWIYDPDHSLPPGMYVDVPHLDCLLECRDRCHSKEQRKLTISTYPVQLIASFAASAQCPSHQIRLALHHQRCSH
jgi:hypothetical protein